MICLREINIGTSRTAQATKAKRNVVLSRLRLGCAVCQSQSQCLCLCQYLAAASYAVV